MLTFKEIKEIADKQRVGLDMYDEYKDVYMFYGSDDGDEDGGEMQPIIVYKTTGKVQYIPECLGSNPRKISDDNLVKERVRIE